MRLKCKSIQFVFFDQKFCILNKNVSTFPVRNITNINEADQLQNFLFKTFRRRVDASSTISWLRPGVFRSDLRIIFICAMRNTPEKNQANAITALSTEQTEFLLKTLSDPFLTFTPEEFKKDFERIYLAAINNPEIPLKRRKEFQAFKNLVVSMFESLYQLRKPTFDYYFSKGGLS